MDDYYLNWINIPHTIGILEGPTEENSQLTSSTLLRKATKDVHWSLPTEQGWMIICLIT